jgi:putative membrane protein
VRTTLKRGIGRGAALNGNVNGNVVLPPGALTPMARYRQPDTRPPHGLAWRFGKFLFWLGVLVLMVSGGAAGGLYGSQGATSPAAGTQGQGLSQAEQQWMQQTMMVGSVALQTSEIALQKAQDEDVKQFAQFERDEQQTIAEVLRSMMEPAGTASQGGAQAQPQPDQQHAAMIQKLQQAKADAFDKEYIQGQLQGHQELLQIQERFLQGRPQNREAMNAAKLARGHIKEHLALLKDIQEGL